MKTETKVEQVAGNFARTYEELASRLGVTRQTIYNVQKKFPHSWPRPRADGRHEINAWMTFFSDNEVASRQMNADFDDDLKNRLLREQIRKLELANDALEKQLVPIDEILAALRPTLAAFRTALDNLAHRAALKIGGDYHEVYGIVEGEIEIALRTFAGAAWFDEGVSVEVPAVQIDTSDIPLIDGQDPQKKPIGKAKRK
jgi:transcriptional regulator with XRE-family HTH domain